MRILNILFCCIFLYTCKAQPPEFKAYLNNFGQSEIPLLLKDIQSSSAVFCQAYDTLSRAKTTRSIPEGIVAKYICKNGLCSPDGGYFRYDYGVKIDFSRDFISVLVSKLQYEGNVEWDFDLRETLLITYNNKGEILSYQSLTKDNGRWKSNLKITKDSIIVKQTKITEPKIDQYHHDLHCEYWTTIYKVTNDGMIKTINTSSVSSGIVIWDKSIEDYKLKE